MILKYDNLIYKLILLSLIVFPIGTRVFLTFRPLDIVIFCIIILSINKIKINSNLFVIYILFFMTLLISILCGLFLSEQLKLEKIIFLYKFIMPFLLYLSIVRIDFTKRQLSKIIHTSFIIFLFMSLWVFAYYYMKLNGIIIGHTRVSFPLSNYVYSDAHLYSVYLSISIIFFISIRDKILYSNFFFYVTIVISILATLITASRSGTVILFIGFMYIFISKLTLRSFFKLILIILLSLCIIVITVNFLSDDINGMIEPLFNRAFSFNISNDDSVSIRFLSLETAFSDSSSLFNLLGVGVLSSSKVWFDGGLSTFIANTGFIGFMLFIGFIVAFVISIIKYKNKYSSILVLIFILYGLINFISEYFLVTRSIFMFVIYISVLYILMNQNNLIKENR